MKASVKKPKAKAKKNSKTAAAREGQIVPRVKKPAIPELPITKLIADAQADGKQLVQLPKGELTQSNRVVVHSSILLEASPGSLLPPTLHVPGIVVTGEASLTLRHVCIKFKGGPPSGETLIEVRSGARLELIDCHLDGAGVKVCPDAFAHLTRTRVYKSSSCGISAFDSGELVLRECEIMDCEGEGVHSTSGKRLCISDSRMARNTLSGVLVDGKPGEAKLTGCTLCENGHFGIWVDSGCSVSWQRNALSGNMLGDTGGRGSLDGEVKTFKVGDACSVWCEDKAVWLPGIVSKVLDDSFIVSAELPDKLEVRMEAMQQRIRKKTKAAQKGRQIEIKARDDSIRLPSGGDEPPSWSKKLKTYKRRQNAFNLFLREGGRSTSAWKALDPNERTKYQMRARKLDKDKEKELTKADKPQTIIQSNQLVKSIAKHKRGQSQA